MMSRTVAMGPPGQRSDGVQLAEALRGWYRPRRLEYPWRGSSDPYAVLVSEVMLQQTQAARVSPAFSRFLAAYPTVGALAAASRAEVLRTWDGLGYNRRALALAECARAIERDHDGAVPSDPATLETLPGVGPYTAAAVASIAFGIPVPALDTNVRRVVARVRIGAEAHVAGPLSVRESAEAWLDPRDPGAWNQALMDLGRQVCRPIPRCGGCPLTRGCRFLARGARPQRAPRRQGAFAGSSRQVRGAVVRLLRETSPASFASIVRRSGFEHRRVREAVGALHRDGLVVAGPAAIEGRSGGRIRLPA